MRHQDKVDRIASQLRFCKGGAVVKRGKKPSNTTRTGSYKAGCTLVEMGDLDEVIAIDRAKMRAVVEPQLTMEKLVQATLKQSLIPAVVPEFRSITVGGAFQGGGIESSSHVYGLFDEGCPEIEVILGNGQWMVASEEIHQELYDALAGSYGSLGLTTSVTLQLIEAAPYVRVQYDHLSSAKEAIARMEQLTYASEPPLYLEALLFSKEHAVVISGTLCDDTSLPIHPLHPWSEWFYQRASHTHQPELIPIEDYLFRYDRGAFWMGRYALDPVVQWGRVSHQMPPGYQPRAIEPGRIHRLLLGQWLTSKRLYRQLHKMPEQLLADTFMIQDCVVPYSKSINFVNEMQEAFSVYPIWLCPVKAALRPKLFSPDYLPQHEDGLLLNVGLYGIPSWEKGVQHATQHLEQRLAVYGGRKGLYSQSYYSEQELGNIYDLTRYETLRRDYHAETTFVSIEQKVTRAIG